MTQPDGIVRLDARAVRASVDLVSGVGEADLARPTPCAGWTLADLLEHMTVQHDGFAAAAAGQGADLERWRPVHHEPSVLVTAYTNAASRVLDAFGADGVLDRTFCLPEISTAIEFPGRQAIGFHFIDYVVHGWDVARSLGLGYALEPGLLAPALEIAAAVPDGARRLSPGAAFAPRIAPAADGDTLDTILALLGRRSEWPALR